MKEFIRKYDDRIHGVLSCFDRMLFRGYLPIMSGWAMAEFLYRLNVNFGNLKAFLLQNSERVKNHAIAMAKKHGRPFRYLASNTVARSRFSSRNHFRISDPSLNLHGGSVYTCTSTSWIATSA